MYGKVLLWGRCGFIAILHLWNTFVSPLFEPSDPLRAQEKGLELKDS